MKEKLQIRLQKVIADCGVTSRRKAEELIVQGRVKVNEEVVSTLGTKVDPHEDVVQVDDQVIDLNAVQRIYMVMNKPRGYVTTLNDPEGRKTVMDLCQEVSERIYPVGRLDYLSEGLLVLTNDGEMANFIMHPRHEIVKVYEVKVFGAVTEKILTSLRKGVHTDEGFLKPQSVRIIKQLKGKTWLEFRLGEGKNREIRRICEACGLTVDKLKRMAIGGLSVEGIAPGKFLYISRNQLMEELGFSVDGKPKKAAKIFKSTKRTVNIKKKGAQPTTAADDSVFHMYRKDTYFKTIKELKEKKAQMRSPTAPAGRTPRPVNKKSQR